MTTVMTKTIRKRNEHDNGIDDKNTKLTTQNLSIRHQDGTLKCNNTKSSNNYNKVRLYKNLTDGLRLKIRTNKPKATNFVLQD
jgi:hypothetical protein